MKNNIIHKDRCKGQVEIDISTLSHEDVLTNWFILDTASSEDKQETKVRPTSIRLKVQYSSSDRGKMNQLYEMTSLDKYTALQIFFERRIVRQICTIFNHNELAPNSQEIGALFQIAIDSTKMDVTDIIHFLVEHEIEQSSNIDRYFFSNFSR
jgi:hypothetical protein